MVGLVLASMLSLVAALPQWCGRNTPDAEAPETAAVGLQQAVTWCCFVQVPLVFITESLKKWAHSDHYGNVIFWVTFCMIGQPTCMILYYHDWVRLFSYLCCQPLCSLE